MRRRQQQSRDVFDTGPFGSYRSLGNGDDENGGGTQQADTSTVDATIWSYSNKLISYTEAYNILMNTYGMSDNDIWDMLGGDPDTGGTETQQSVDAYEQAQAEKEAAYGAPEDRTLYSPSMQFESRNVGVATKPNQKIPGTQFHYWDGDIEQHSWKLHGISTVKNKTGYDPVTKKYDLTYPEVMVDAMGSYGMCLSHYIARYNPEDASEFYGWEVLRPSEAEGGVDAGIPIATVMQMFVKPGYDPEGRDWQDYFAGGNIMSEDMWRTFEKKPVWRFANGMKMTKESFFLLEPELAAKNKKPALTNAQIDEEAAGVMSSKYLTWKKGNYVFGGRMTDHVTMSALEKLEDVGYNERKTIFKSGLLGTNAPKKRAVLDAEYGGIDIFGFNIGETNKKDHAAKVEWLAEGGTFGSFSKFPDAIADTDGFGKTMRSKST